MKARSIRTIITKIKVPLNFYTSGGRMQYVHHTESALVSKWPLRRAG